MSKKKLDFLKTYAGALTSAWVFVIYSFLMITFTKKDWLEIIVVYCIFLMFPAFALPFFIAGEGEGDDDTE